VYDCFYLALADREDSIVVTAEGRLAGKLAGTDWARLVVPLVHAGGGF
jgi:predicted nucleic acid-binding protein